MAEEQITIVYDTELHRPACVILQAVMGGDRMRTSFLFDSRKWLTAPTPGMRRVVGTFEEWKEVAAEVNASC